MVRRSIRNVTGDDVENLPGSCHTCAYWETKKKIRPDDQFPEDDLKRDWYQHVLSDWGPCGKLVRQEGQSLAYCQYSPAEFLSQLHNYNLGPVSKDAILLSCLYVPEPYRGRGLGKLLISAVQKDLAKRGYRAVETFARGAPARNPSGWTEFYLKNGWQVIQESKSMSLLRLDLRASVSWQINLEAVLEGLQIPIGRRSKIRVPIPG